MGLCFEVFLVLAAMVVYCEASLSSSRSTFSCNPACFVLALKQTTAFRPQHRHGGLLGDVARTRFEFPVSRKNGRSEAWFERSTRRVRPNGHPVRSLAARPPKASERETRNSYNDDAFGLIFLNSAVVLRDFNFAASFLLLSAIVAASVSAGTVRLRSWLPGAVAFISFFVARLAAAFGSGPMDWASEWAENSAVGPAFGLESDGVLLLEIAACAVSLLWGITQDSGVDS